MKKLIIAGCCILFFLPELLSQSCDQIWEKCKIALSPIEKLELLSAYIDSDCKDSVTQALLQRGKIYDEFGDTAVANTDFRRAVEANPDLSEGWYLLAKSAYLNNHADTMGLLFINRAIKADTNNWYFFMLRGDILTAGIDRRSGQSDYKKSIELLTSGIRKDDHALVLAHTALGGSLLEFSMLENDQKSKQDLISKAIENLSRAVEIDSLFGNAFFLLGNAFFYQKNYEKSIKALEQCRNLNPFAPDVSANLAIVYRETGKYYGEQKHDLKKALEYLDKSYQLIPEDVETLRLLGVANGINGDFKQALNWFIRASELAPGNAAIWWGLSATYALLGDNEKMEACRKKALSLDPAIEQKMKN